MTVKTLKVTSKKIASVLILLVLVFPPQNKKDQKTGSDTCNSQRDPSLYVRSVAGTGRYTTSYHHHVQYRVHVPTEGERGEEGGEEERGEECSPSTCSTSSFDMSSMADTLAMVSSSMSLRVGEGEGKEVFEKGSQKINK